MTRHAPSARFATLVVVTLVLAGCSVAGGETAVSDPPTSGAGPRTAVVADESVVAVDVAQEPELPTSVASPDGRTVVVDDVSRILAVDLHGTLAEIVFGLGLGDNVVGRDSSTGFPEAADLPLVTVGGHALNAEAILDLDPTVVLTDDSLGPPEVLDQLVAAGVAVVPFDPTLVVDGIDDQILEVAAALGVEAAGDALAERVVDELAAARPDQGDGAPPRVAFLYMRGTAVALMAGPGSGADAMIEAVGAVNVGTDIGLTQQFVPLTSEALITAAPDVILMMSGGLKSINGVDGLLKVPGVAQTPAGRDRRVVDMEDTLLLSFGPRTPAVITALAEAVHGT